MILSSYLISEHFTLDISIFVIILQFGKLRHTVRAGGGDLPKVTWKPRGRAPNLLCPNLVPCFLNYVVVT